VTGTVTGVERIAAAFAEHGKRAALMPYLMGGFPDLATSRAIGEAYADAGADLVELGIPFSDPLADGPVIHAAAGLAERLPVVIMCYANIVYARGFETFADALREHGVSGLIVPDLPLEEAPALLEQCDARGIALVPLVAPTTPDERLRRIGAGARGFLYTVSVTGTTGERGSLDVEEIIRRASAATEVPVALGFGISTPAQAAAAADAGAAGVIVGSRLVRAATEAVDPVAEVRALVGAMAAALR
jgi:tryptophan synthase alpha chain